MHNTDDVSLGSVEQMILATGLSPQELAALLDLPESMFDGSKATRLLPGSVKARLARMVLVLERAQRVLGDGPRGLQWLKHPNRALSFSSPLVLLATGKGTERVLAALDQIGGGGFVGGACMDPVRSRDGGV